MVSSGHGGNLGRRKVGESYSGPIREVKAKLPHWGAALDSAQNDVVKGAGRRSRAESGTEGSGGRVEGHPGRARGARRTSRWQGGRAARKLGQGVSGYYVPQSARPPVRGEPHQCAYHSGENCLQHSRPPSGGPEAGRSALPPA